MLTFAEWSADHQRQAVFFWKQEIDSWPQKYIGYPDSILVHVVALDNQRPAHNDVSSVTSV